MHKRGLCRHAVSVCPCVCVCVCASVTFVDSIKTSNRIVKIFPSSGSQAILVCPYQTTWQYSDGNTPNGGVKCRWGRHKSRSSWYSWLSIDDVLHGPVNNKCDDSPCIVYHTYGDASVKLYLSQPTTERGEQNSIRSGKSEAELALYVLYYWR